MKVGRLNDIVNGSEKRRHLSHPSPKMKKKQESALATMRTGAAMSKKSRKNGRESPSFAGKMFQDLKKWRRLHDIVAKCLRKLLDSHFCICL